MEFWAADSFFLMCPITFFLKHVTPAGVSGVKEDP